MAAIDELLFRRQNLRRALACWRYISTVLFVKTIGQGLNVKSSSGYRRSVSYGASCCQTNGFSRLDRERLAPYSEIAYQTTKQTQSGPTMTSDASVSSKLRRFFLTVSVKFDDENRNPYRPLRLCLLPNFSAGFSQLACSSIE